MTAHDLAGYNPCQLCPRNCRVNRDAGERGVCGETSVCRIGSYCAHFGEEPPISGTRGSGTIFFTGCSCGCFFCQNYQISRDRFGDETSVQQLVAMCRRLVAQGVHNLNMVTPDHFWPHIQAACRHLREDNVTIPFLYNCSGYERAELISDVADLFHIFMPDVKFASPDLAAMCMNAPDYPEVAMAALEQMVATRGFLEPFDVTGTRTAREGVLVRHLVLPGHADDSIRLLRQLRDRFGRMLPLSVLSQYKPMPECTRRGQLTRQVTADDYQRVCNTLHELDFQQVFIQNLDGESEFLPDFQRKTPFPGNRQ